MKLAFVSYEYPPDTAFGGIGTYVYMISRAMRRMGHDVEVFCASKERNSMQELFEDGVIVHRVKCTNRKKFPALIADVFAARHQTVQFELIESPEFEAEGHVIRERFPEVALAVKLHTPMFLVRELNSSYNKKSFLSSLKARFQAPYDKATDKEYQLAVHADDLSSPSVALQQLVAARWNIPLSQIHLRPYVYLPEKTYLNIPIQTNTGRITFTGRLEVRKGVLALAQAIPLVLQKHPHLKFRFVGKAEPAPDGSSMDTYLKKHLAAYASQLEFIPRVPPKDIPALLSDTDICVYPSLWENFPNVCLEAMSAGRGIVASRNSGMPDMLEDINGGMLVDPQNPADIANAIIWLAEHPEERMAMGERCRRKITTYYNGSLMQEISDAYTNIIHKKRTG